MKKELTITLFDFYKTSGSFNISVLMVQTDFKGKFQSLSLIGFKRITINYYLDLLFFRFKIK